VRERCWTTLRSASFRETRPQAHDGRYSRLRKSVRTSNCYGNDGQTRQYRRALKWEALKRLSSLPSARPNTTPTLPRCASSADSSWKGKFGPDTVPLDPDSVPLPFSLGLSPPQAGLVAPRPVVLHSLAGPLSLDQLFHLNSGFTESSSPTRSTQRVCF